MGLLDKLFGKKPAHEIADADHEAHHDEAPDPGEHWDAAAHELNAEELKALIASGDENLMLLDVREMWEFNSGNIPGSINIPLSELGIMLRDLETGKTYITICAMGQRSLQAAYQLSTHGFDDVRSLHGGMSAWNRAQ